VADLLSIHEAGHGLVAWTNRVEIQSLSIVPHEEHLGIARFDADSGANRSDIAWASIFVAGEIAERKAWGREPRFNWFSSDADADNARWFCDRYEDPLDARSLATLKARSALAVRWSAVQALADELERMKVLPGSWVEEILRANGCRKNGEIDPEKRYVSVGGKTVTLRQWANALDANAKHRERAIRAIKGGRK
jgi:hypothetical protein